jgi:hypothetical protein
MSKSSVKIILEFVQYCEATNKTITNKDLITLCNKCEILFAEQIAMAYDAGLEHGVRESDVMVTDEPLPLFGEKYYKEKFL